MTARTEEAPAVAPIYRMRPIHRRVHVEQLVDALPRTDRGVARGVVSYEPVRNASPVERRLARIIGVADPVTGATDELVVVDRTGLRTIPLSCLVAIEAEGADR